MQKLVSWERFVNESSGQLSPSQIEFIESHLPEGDTWKVDEKTGLVDLYTNHFAVENEQLKELPVKFGRCFGDFKIADCGLESIEGVPISCTNLFLARNKIKSVRGGMNIRTSGAFNISVNPLTSFAGIGPGCYFHSLFAWECKLITLQGIDGPTFKSYNFEDNPIPQSTLLDSLNSDNRIYYKKILRDYKDIVLDLWDDLDPEIQDSIADAHDESVEDFKKWMKASTRIY